MDYEVELPDLGPEGGDHATVTVWNFEEDEYVEEGDILLEVSCDAGTVEVIARRSGVLLERVVDEDDIVKVGEPVAIIDVSDSEEPPTEPIEEEEEPAVDLGGLDADLDADDEETE